MSSWHLEFCNWWEYIESGTFGSNTKSDVQIASKRVLSMKAKRANWSLWSGFLLRVVAAVSYFLLFARFPMTHDFPWVNFLLFGLAVALLGLGLRRAFTNSRVYRGKVSGSVLAGASGAIPGGI